MKTTNVKFAGLGGQGILTCTDILGRVVFDMGHDVKKAEVHGMSQRGGAITSDLLVKLTFWLCWVKTKSRLTNTISSQTGFS